ncbi:hypothetical protein C943_00840 [Mariniradius saccharolyticus AK6]|uniref:Uncharacterized protein n=1 Tax=Mariniradius saccharolyticus AK6 TaxID=1239962 RepID=M7XD76_9BACT|nr:hypothetical protein C943_00840 [Mariniradius saccharolyticus AK6]
MKNINNIVDITPNRDDIINIEDIQSLCGSLKETVNNERRQFISTFLLSDFRTDTWCIDN